MVRILITMTVRWDCVAVNKDEAWMDVGEGIVGNY